MATVTLENSVMCFNLHPSQRRINMWWAADILRTRSLDSLRTWDWEDAAIFIQHHCSWLLYAKKQWRNVSNPTVTFFTAIVFGVFFCCLMPSSKSEIQCHKNPRDKYAYYVDLVISKFNNMALFPLVHGIILVERHHEDSVKVHAFNFILADNECRLWVIREPISWVNDLIVL